MACACGGVGPGAMVSGGWARPLALSSAVCLLRVLRRPRLLNTAQQACFLAVG